MNKHTAHLEHLNRIIKPEKGPYIRPKDAATLILVDSSAGTPRILMGKRHEAHAFMPGKYVFPGGRMCAADSRAQILEQLDEASVEKLTYKMKGKASPARARGLVMSAIRETFEETGLALGAKPPRAFSSRSKDWNPFFKTGLAPVLDKFVFAARAITPPGRPRRFDARFFIADYNRIDKETKAGPEGDGELLDIAWLTIDEACGKDLPLITRIILKEIEDRLQSPDGWSPDYPVPFYYFQNNRFELELI